MIRFELLGEIGLRTGDGVQLDAVLRQPKRLALLAYLSAPTPGTWHRRDIVIARFWPELDTPRARSALRNALYVLRQALGEEVLKTRGDEEISVDPARLGTDLGELVTVLSEGRAEEALARYRGDLLPGLFPPDSQGFQQWLEQERGRLRVDVARAGLQWADELVATRRTGEARVVVRRVLEITPDDETAVRRLMTIHEAIGDRAGGLTVYEGYRNRLAAEYSAVPAAETVALAERLRGPALPQEHATPGAEPTSTGRPVPRPASPRRRRWLAGTGIVAALAVSAYAMWRVTRTPSAPVIGASRPLTFEEGLQVQPAISPNGRVVAYVKGTSRRMRVFVQRLNGGPPRPLTSDSSINELTPRWSPDSDDLVFLSRNGAWVAPASGGPARLLVEGGEGDAMVRSASWSPNGDSVLVVRNDSLTVRPLEGAGGRFVGTASQIHSCVWSPTRPWIACVAGNWVAYTPGPLFGNRAPSAIVLFPAGGGPPIDLTDREKEYESPAWSHDGRRLWVVSDRDGLPGEVYAIEVGADGRRRGDYRRVGLNAESISLAAGAIAWSVPVRRANVWSVPIPARGPVTLDEARAVTSGNQVIEVPSVSRDGRWLVYDSNLRGNSDIYRMPVDGGPLERLTDDPREEFGAALGPDNVQLAYHLWVGGERRVMVKVLADATVREVMQGPGDWGVPRWAPDGRALVAWSHAREEGAITVVRRDTTGAWQAPAWSLGNAQLPVWSPDGRTIAFVQLAGSIGLIPSDSGATRLVYAPRPGTDDPVATFLLWEHHQDRLAFLGHDPTGRGGIWELPLRGGRPSLLVDFGDRTSGPALASDGARFFFTLDDRQSNIRWAALTTK